VTAEAGKPERSGPIHVLIIIDETMRRKRAGITSSSNEQIML